LTAFLALVAAAGLSAAAFFFYRLWIVRWRRPGLGLQDVVRPVWAEALLVADGLAAVVLAAVWVGFDARSWELWGWVCLFLFAILVFESACWALGIHHFSFHDRGLWYGPTWVPYRDIRSYQLDGDVVRISTARRSWTVRTLGPVSPEVRLRLSVEGWS
jgi:hypothetical protein